MKLFRAEDTKSCFQRQCNIVSGHISLGNLSAASQSTETNLFSKVKHRSSHRGRTNTSRCDSQGV